MREYVIFTEILKEGGSDLYYYGSYDNRDEANETAISLGNDYPVFHGVCTKAHAIEWGVQNLPH